MTDLTAPKPGDLFYFPAVNANDEPGFVIARYIELIPPALGHLIEVFAHFYTQIPASIEQVDTSRRLFRPIFCSLRSSGIPRWKILFSDPGYKKPSSHYEKIQFAFIKANLDGWYQPSSDRRTTFGDRAFPLLAKGPCCFSRNYSSTRSHRGKRMHGAL